jgi:hypothetical protein
MMVYGMAMLTLRDMFPGHSPTLIDYVLRQNDGILDATINQLLSVPAARQPQAGEGGT